MSSPLVMAAFDSPGSTLLVLFLLLTVAVVSLASVGRQTQLRLVREMEIALHWRRGVYVGRLAPGVHRLWGRHHEVLVFDSRRQRIPIAGQEVLTKDSVSVKISLTLALRTPEPEKSLAVARDFTGELYAGLQQQLRTLVSEQTIEELLEQRGALGARLLEAGRSRAEALALVLEEVEVRDIMLPGALREAFAEVVTARKRGQAALERARGEQAALRNLANAARMLEGNPALLNLRILQTMTDPAAKDRTFVVGDLLSSARQSGPATTQSADDASRGD